MSNKKIAVISFDHWEYDKHIVSTLLEKGIDATHIKIGGLRHQNLLQRMTNTFSKVFLNKNPKLKKRQDFILETLSKIGFQDQILVINPELIDLEYHLEIKKFTNKYIAYLYDSVDRCPVEHLLNRVFDIIFSFDDNDISKYNFKKTNNYIYFDKKPLDQKKTEFDIFYLASYDKRLELLNQISRKLNEINKTYLFIVVGKKTWKKSLLNFFNNSNKSIIYRRNRIKQEDIGFYYSKTNVILDLVRDNQIGLSFRVFEAMAFQKKLITSNKSIKNYDFYNPKNILIVDKSNLIFESTFFESNYEPLSDDIYRKYTLNSWVENVFELQK